MRHVPTASLKQLHSLIGLNKVALSEEFRGTILLSVDCEAYEFDHKKVTEVGLSYVDTRDLQVGNSESWASHVTSSHYRIDEHRHLRNGRFSKGNPKAFAFGESRWLKLRDASTVLKSIFANPGGKARLKSPNVVLVGHALKNDIAYLSLLGIDPLDMPNVVMRIDTQSIAATSKKQRPSLRNLLSALELPAEHFHNAGNDAYYTLRALLSIAVKECALPGSVSSSLLRAEQPSGWPSKERHEEDKQEGENGTKP